MGARRREGLACEVQALRMTGEEAGEGSSGQAFVEAFSSPTLITQMTGDRGLAL